MDCLHTYIHIGVGTSTSLNDDQLGLEAGGLCPKTADALCNLRAHLPVYDEVNEMRCGESLMAIGGRSKAYFASAVPSISLAIGLGMVVVKERSGK